MSEYRKLKLNDILTQFVAMFTNLNRICRQLLPDFASLPRYVLNGQSTRRELELSYRFPTQQRETT